MSAQHQHQVPNEDSGPLNPDFVAVGLGGTSMMSMLWTVAMGRTAVGVEMRGDPFLGVHWNLRVDLYHQLGLIDELMFDRYGEDGIPRRGDGRLFKLADVFYSTQTVAGDIVADEVIDGFDSEQHIVGTIHHVEFIDDRWRQGLPHRVVSLLQPPPPPDRPDPKAIRSNVAEVLDGPSTFQAGAASVQVLMRRYLEGIEELDRQRGRPPRCRVFSRHRVLTPDGDGWVDVGDGRLGIRIEALQEFDYRGKFVRVRVPGSDVIDIGVPELFMIAEGYHSTDALRLGFHQHDVEIDHHDGRGPLVAQADFLAGLIEALVGPRLRRRISSEFDHQGAEYWVRQIAVGHEEDPEVGWVLVQVPDFQTFDPIEAGLVPEGTDPDSGEFFAAYQILLYDFYLEQASQILEIPEDELRKVEMVYGPKLFSLIERIGDDPQVAANGVVAGDSFGNGHFLTSGGAVTGMVGHSARVLHYWQDRERGAEPASAICRLAEGIKEDTEGWLRVSAREYTEAAPINFGAERIAQLAGVAVSGAGGGEASGSATGVGIDVDGAAGAGAGGAAGADGAAGAGAPAPGSGNGQAMAGAGPAPAQPNLVEAGRRKRHSLLPLDPSDWRRIFLRNGAVRSAPLPELHAMHPALRSQRTAAKGARIGVALVMPKLTPEALHIATAVLDQPGSRVWLISDVGPYLLPEKLALRVTGYWRVPDCTQREHVENAIRDLTAAHGEIDVVVGTAAELDVMLGEIRDHEGLRGLSAKTTQQFVDQATVLRLLGEGGLPVGGEVAGSAVPQGAVSCTLDVMSIAGIPAWSSATRTADHALADGLDARTITLPREENDPADAPVRLMGLAALRLLKMRSGLSQMTWLRRPDGNAVITGLNVRVPAPEFMALMSQAHGADMYRAWANAAVRGLFAPIPRLFAAGVAFPQLLGGGAAGLVLGVPGLEQVQAALGEVIVETVLPVTGTPAGRIGNPYIVVRHPETAVVDDALRRLVTEVRVEIG
ncbi:MAG: hypothetical protein ACRDZ8_20580 [Acidimicrobiales bacterium]